MVIHPPAECLIGPHRMEMQKNAQLRHMMHFPYKRLALHVHLTLGSASMVFPYLLEFSCSDAEVVRYSTELYELFEHAKNVEDGKQNDLKRILMVVLSGQLSPQHFTAPKVYLEATSRQTSSPEDGACEEDVSAPFLAL
jgi:hypothetical protein